MKLRFKPHPKPSTRQPGQQTNPRTSLAQSKVQPRPKTKGDSSPTRLKSRPGYIRCVFTLSLSEYRILQICMEERGLGPGSYNAALQTILREWKVLKERQHRPALISVPADMLPSKYTLGEE
jgi:hypothetical protein